MYAPRPPFGCTSTVGARHVAGSVSVSVMRALPSAEIGTEAVVAAAAEASGAQ